MQYLELSIMTGPYKFNLQAARSLQILPTGYQVPSNLTYRLPGPYKFNLPETITDHLCTMVVIPPLV